MRHSIQQRPDHSRTMPAAAGEEVIELTFLLPVAQAEVQEATAARQGLTVGQLLRRLVRDCPPAAMHQSERGMPQSGEKSDDGRRSATQGRSPGNC
jgi:hypothetical protein